MHKIYFIQIIYKLMYYYSMQTLKKNIYHYYLDDLKLTALIIIL